MDWQPVDAQVQENKPHVVWVNEQPALATLTGDRYDAWWVVVEGDGLTYYLPPGAFRQYLQVEAPKDEDSIKIR
jgi:hypothetical protein